MKIGEMESEDFKKMLVEAFTEAINNAASQAVEDAEEITEFSKLSDEEKEGILEIRDKMEEFREPGKPNLEAYMFNMFLWKEFGTRPDLVELFCRLLDEQDKEINIDYDIAPDGRVKVNMITWVN